jgi:hypothetical protein
MHGQEERKTRYVGDPPGALRGPLRGAYIRTTDPVIAEHFETEYHDSRASGRVLPVGQR